MKTLCKNFFFTAILLSVSLNPLFAQMQVKQTFASCSAYVPYEEPGGECSLLYKKAGEIVWKEGFPPIYDSANKEFRGSLVRLSENTDYQVQAVVSVNGQKRKEFTAEFKTWNSNPPIAKTLKISSFKEPLSPGYLIENIQGSVDGWIKITGDCEVQAIDMQEEYAIKILNSHYVIVENVTVIGGGRHGIHIPGGSSQIRIQNCNISKWGRVSKIQNERGVYTDDQNKTINYDGGVRLDSVGDIVVERCYIHDPKAKTNPWKGVIEDGPYRGTAYQGTHPEGPSGIYVNQALGGVVVRYNDIIGSQVHRFNDPVETAQNRNKDGGFHRDADIYGNVLAFGQDDGIELDGGQCNIRFYDNRIEQVLCGISTAPNIQGPSYIFNNVVWNLGDVTEEASVAVKNGGGATFSLGRQFLFHNTMIVSKNGMTGIGYGRDENRAMFRATTRNNIFVSGQKPLIAEDKRLGLSIDDRHQSPWNDFDYDLIGNTKTPDGKGMILAHVGAEPNGVFALPEFEDKTQGVFSLKQADKGIDKGTVIPNFSDRFSGNAPDMGAFEFSSRYGIPFRPLDIRSDKYYVNLQAGVSDKIILAVGAIPHPDHFTVYQSDDMTWLEVTPRSGEIVSDSSITFSLKARQTESKIKQRGMIIIRLENGMSVPVTVCVE
ncbi:MAG: right-handed parallel beta-helix repeat-containing protein [Dysgonamonadaceae bacterium]|jgi:hypothetical protein|nr:right-handed parallel beta-helix repeat-containing protein [Dysgonamonadaceae bacterium]